MVFFADQGHLQLPHQQDGASKLGHRLRPDPGSNLGRQHVVHDHRHGPAVPHHRVYALQLRVVLQPRELRITGPKIHISLHFYTTFESLFLGSLKEDLFYFFLIIFQDFLFFMLTL